MPHPADFVDAHCRHWADAELLFERGRWANADQLYGFSAECGLKAVMKTLGMLVDAAGTPQEREHRVHVRELWPIFGTFAAGRRGARYLRLVPDNDPFSDWSHHDRYAHGGHFDAGRVGSHREAARRVCGMVQGTRQDELP